MIQRMGARSCRRCASALFRCVSIRENDDGTYAITAVQHVPEKEAIVDNGAHFDGDQSGHGEWRHAAHAVQHLTAEVTADSRISGAGALGHAEGGEGRELYASPDRGSG